MCKPLRAVADGGRRRRDFGGGGLDGRFRRRSQRYGVRTSRLKRDCLIFSAFPCPGIILTGLFLSPVSIPSIPCYNVRVKEK